MLFITLFPAIRYNSLVDSSIFALECRHTLISKVTFFIKGKLSREDSLKISGSFVIKFDVTS